MIESCKVTTFGESQMSDDYCSIDEPTYANETEWFFHNASSVKYPNSNNNVNLDELYRKIDKQSFQDEKNRHDAAIKIQRFYRNYRLKQIPSSSKICIEKYRKLNQSVDNCDESNYIQFLEERDGSNRVSLNTNSDGIDQGFESWSNDDSTAANNFVVDSLIDKENDQIEDSLEFNNEHIYDSIPYDTLPSPTPPASPLTTKPSTHHLDCPLYRVRKLSEDFSQNNKYIQQTNEESSNIMDNNSRLHQHRKSESKSQHSIVVCEHDHPKNLYVIQSPLTSQPNASTSSNSTSHSSNYPNFVVLPDKHKQQYGQNCIVVAAPHHRKMQQQQPIIMHQQQKQMAQKSKEQQMKKAIISKRLYRVALNLFNENPAAGISYLIKQKFVLPQPSAIAKFLLTKSGVGRVAVGEYLGLLSNNLAQEVTKYIMRRINMKKKYVDEALRSLIYYVHLPGESQKISRLMEEFQESYIQQNTGNKRLLFQSRDTVMVLAYAIIMLQTDAHNQSIKKTDKMTQEQFVNNLRGVDDGNDINRAMLEQIYARVTQKEMKNMPDHCDQIRKLSEYILPGNASVPSNSNNSNNSNSNLSSGSGATGSTKSLNNFIVSSRSRRFMCYCRLNELPDEKKNKTDAHPREVFLFNDMLLVTKIQNKLKKDDNCYVCKHCFLLSDIRVKQFKNNSTQFGIMFLSRHESSSATNDNSVSQQPEVLLKLTARCEEDHRKFYFDLVDCIYESMEMDNLRNKLENYSSNTIRSLHSNGSGSSGGNHSNNGNDSCHSNDTNQSFVTHTSPKVLPLKTSANKVNKPQHPHNIQQSSSSNNQMIYLGNHHLVPSNSRHASLVPNNHQIIVIPNNSSHTSSHSNQHYIRLPSNSNHNAPAPPLPPTPPSSANVRILQYPHKTTVSSSSHILHSPNMNLSNSTTPNPPRRQQSLKNELEMSIVPNNQVHMVPNHQEYRFISHHDNQPPPNYRSPRNVIHYNNPGHPGNMQP